MKKKIPPVFWLAPALAVFFAGFALAAFYDLAITRALYNPNNLFAIFMEGFGWYPAFLPALFYFALLLCAPAGAQKPWSRAGAAIVLPCGFAAMYHSSYGTLVKRGLTTGPANPRTWGWLAAGLVFAALLLWLAGRLNAGQRQKAKFWALCGFCYMLANQALINLIKAIWQRTRFDDMLATGSFAAFTPWYQPLGNGGSSFPSGHTANAVSILLAIVLLDMAAVYGKRRMAAYAACWLYIAAMAFARLVIGRHFLSDTLAGAGIMALLFFALRLTPFYKKGLAKIQPVRSGKPEEP